MIQPRNKFIFTANYALAINGITDPKVKLAVYDALTTYALTGELLEVPKEAKIVWTLIKGMLDQSYIRSINATNQVRLSK